MSTPIPTPATLREQHRAALRAVLDLMGITRPALARLCGVSEHLAEAWVRPDVSAAMDDALSCAEPLPLDDARAARFAGLAGEAIAAVVSPARRTTEGARRAARALALLRGDAAHVAPALEVLEVRRAA